MTYEHMNSAMFGGALNRENVKDHTAKYTIEPILFQCDCMGGGGVLTIYFPEGQFFSKVSKNHRRCLF